LAEATGDPFISIAGQWATDNFCSQISDSPIAWVPNPSVRVHLTTGKKCLVLYLRFPFS
jgi:hypothetical protein